MEVLDWTKEDVGRWLKENNFKEYVNLFCKEHKIDGVSLLSLTEHDLREPPLEISILGDIKRLGLAIRKLQIENSSKDMSMVAMDISASSSSSNYPSVARNGESADLSFNVTRNNIEFRKSYRRNTSRTDSVSTEYSNLSEEDEDLNSLNSIASDVSNDVKFPPEYIKLLLSFLFMFAVFLNTAFVMVIVHDRVPDMNKYPPLPDLILDNLPYIPWAFQLCEWTAMSMTIIIGVTLVLHKHRFIIIRRACVLTGTMFMLRCITMLITSLSVPGKHLECMPSPTASWSDKIERAFIIWRGAGMSIQGVRSCGDYMFSGHTVVVTLLNFFITEYTPETVPMLHTAAWIGNIFAIFFILAAHEHYSIDVFVAFYITSRLFLYYHSLANNRVLRQADRRRTRIWFPVFSFFEYRVNGIVPNEYEWPFPKCRMVTDCLKFTFDITDKKKNGNGKSPKKFKGK